MESPDLQIDPNLNAEAYRNHSSSNRPPCVDKQLESIVIYNDETAVIGAANMTDRYWNGTVWYYNDPSKLETRKTLVGSRTETGVRDIAYLGKRDKIVVGEDSGVIQVLELVSRADTQTQELQCLGYACRHDDSVNSISVFPNNTHLVSGGMDCCIKVWDIAEIMPTYSYHQAQTEEITCVEVQAESCSVFGSTSLDGEALLWDVRKSKPAHGLYKKDDCGLISVVWKPEEKNILIIGGADGSLTVIDIRNPYNVLYQSVQFPRSVHRLLFNPKSPHLLAGCCDSTIVKVFDSSKGYEVVYEDNRHSDFVRGLAWHNGDLVTCGWDDSVFRHKLVK